MAEGDLFAHRFWRSADGLTLHARDYAAAAGPALLPVICLHGLTRNAADFDALAPWLAARRRRVLAVDVRGRGLSEWDPAGDYRLPAYADDVARLLDGLGVGRAIFVGTSMGGLITMELAMLRPGLIAAAAINDVGPVLAPAGLARIAAYAGKTPPIDGWSAAADWLRRLNESALPHYRAADWARMARRMFREESGRILPLCDPAIAHPLGANDIEGGEGALSADPWQRWDRLATGRPLLLLRGALSDLLDPDDAEAMVAGRANVALRIVPDIGHAPMLDEPAALAAIGELLDGCP
jgi:pimeloyl-ACP methyl ester carboxylesterase